MAIIAIIGSPGVGKSLLVKQLSALTNQPAFFEGELGTIPPQIIEKIAKGNDPIKMFNFFIQKDKKKLTLARKLSNEKTNCFIDGSVLSSKAYFFDEEKRYHKKLNKQIESIKNLEEIC